MKMFLFLTTLIFTLNSYAKYESTEWGMSLEKVKKLYPGGSFKSDQTGFSTYGVMREVALIPNAFLAFSFDEKKKLKEVVIMFPKPGSSVNVKEQLIQFGSLEDANVHMKMMKERLIMKYGEPAVNQEESIAWKTESDSIILLKSKDGEKYWVSISYGPLPTKESVTKGL